MKYRLLLLLAALIWGGAFVAQRMSTETIGPYGFNGIRFFMGALSVLPIVLYTMHCGRPSVKRPPKWLSLPVATLILGIILFSGNAFQQVGLYYTTAGKAGFITALYIIAVPILGLLLHNPLRLSHAIGCIVAVAGLYLLAFHADTPLNQGDALELCGVLFWAMHILFVSYFVRFYAGVYLATGQFIVCAILNIAAVFLLQEPLTLVQIHNTLGPLLYGGLCSCGIAYTLQIVGQSKVPPTEASLLLSFEMIFCALLSYIILGETMNLREFGGCVLMSCGIFAAQLPSRIIWKGLSAKSGSSAD